MGQKISQLTALSTTYADTDLLEVSVDTGGGTFVTRKMTFLQLRTAFTKLQANLDVNSFQITSASNGNIIIRPNGSGAVLVGGNSSQATELRFMEDSDNGTNYVALKVADALAASTTYTLPTADGTSGQLLSTNGTGTLSWATAGGGLTNFTEAEATTSPNNTVYVDSLTAAGSTTNVDVAIVPKGTGAFMLDIPDNTTTGGDKRGTNAIDLQTTRTNANQVASANNSIVIGANSRASGTQAIAIGTSASATNSGIALSSSGNITGSTASASAVGSFAVNGGSASGLWSFSMGRAVSSNTNAFSFGGYYAGVTASGNDAIAMSDGNIASGNYSLAIGGYGSTASGSFSVAIGGGANIANADVSFAHGYQSHVFGIYGRKVYASGQEGTAGDAQASKFILRERTTDATATTITTNSSAASTNNQVILSNQSAYGFTGTIVGKQSGSTNAAMWKVEGLIVRGANAASTVLTTSTVTLVSNAPGWGTPTLAADTTNGGLQIQVIGATTTNIQWTGVIETTEVIYA